MPRLTPAQIARVAQEAGFSGSALQIAVAVALGESGGNTHAHNAVPPDDSYGLWQINMIGSLGPARRRQFGLSSNSQLFDPATNARAAYAIASRGSNFGPWSVYTNGTYRLHMPRAAEGVRRAGGAVIPETDTGGNATPVTIGGTTRQISFTPANRVQPALTFELEMGRMLARLFGQLGDDVIEDLPGVGPLAGVGTALGSIADLVMVWTAALVKGAAWIGNPDNWVRVAQVVLGGALVISGGAIVAKPYTGPVVNAAMAVATKGKVKKA